MGVGRQLVLESKSSLYFQQVTLSKGTLHSLGLFPSLQSEDSGTGPQECWED
jgi:hypothetical protein